MVSGRIKGHISKESWSRCETPSMLYDTIKNPNACSPKVKAAVKIANIDTIESPQNRLNREVLDRLNSNGLKLPHESFVAVVQVGKYVFLAIMLPPYLLLYGLPRWFIVNVFSVALVETKNFFMSLGKLFKKRSAKVVDLMKGILDQLLGDALRVTRDKVWKAGNFFRSVGVKILRRITKTKEQLLALQQALNLKVFKRIKQKTVKITFKLSELTSFIPTLLIPLKKGLQGLKKFAKFMMAKSAVPFKDLSNLKKVNKKAFAPFKKIKEVYDRLNLRAKLAPFVEKVHLARKKIERKVVNILELCTSWSKEKIQVIQPFVIDVCKTAIMPFNTLYNRIVLYQKSKFAKIGRMAKKVITPFNLALNKSLTGMKRAFAQLSNRMQQKREGASRFKRKGIDLIFSLFSGIKRFSIFFRWFGAGIKKFFVALFSAIKRTAKTLWSYIRLLPSKAFQLLKVLWKYIGKAFDRSMTALCFFIAVMWAVFYVGYYLLKEFNRSQTVSNP